MTEEIGGFSAGQIFLTVTPSFRNFQDAIRKEAKAANKAFGDEVGKDANKTGEQAGKDFTDGFKRGNGKFADDLKRQIRKALAALPTVKIDADSSAADRQIAAIRTQLEALDGHNLKVGVDTKLATLELHKLEEQLKRIALDSTEAEVTVNAGTAYLELHKIQTELRKIDGKRATARVGIDGSDGLLSHLDQSGSAFRAFNGTLLAAVAIGPILIPVLVAIAAAAAGIGVGAIGAAAGLGVMMLAFSGVIGAVKAMSAVQNNSAKDALASAKTMRNAARGVRDASQGTARAQESAARSQETALRRVAAAERSYRDAQKDSLKLQKDLTQARKDAADQLKDLALQAKGGALAERQGVLDLFEATVNNTNTQNDSGATNLDKEQAALALGQAQLNLEQIRAENARIATEQAKAAKTGVDGTDQVITAKENLRRANERVADAARDVALAEQEQARAAIDGARNIADAQERLGDAQAAYGEALQRTGVQGSASMQALELAMGKLSPAGQAFATFLFGLRGFLKDLRTEAQQGFLPGLTTGLQGLITTYGPGLKAFVGDMADALGDLAMRASEVLAGPAWREFFATLSRYAPLFTTMFAQIGGSFLTALASIATALAPFAVKVLQGLADMMASFAAWASSPKGQQAIVDFGDWVLKIGPTVLRFVGNLVVALVQLGKGLAPYAVGLLKAFTGILGFISRVNPKLLGALAVAVVGVVFAVQALLGLVTMLGAIDAIVFAVGLVAEALAAVGVAAAVLFGVPLLILAIGVAFVLLYKNSETFRNGMDKGMKAVGAIVSWLWNKIIKPVFGAIVWYVKMLWNVWSAYFSLIWHIFAYAIKKIGDAWDWFANTGPGKAIVGFFRDVVAPAWQAFVSVAQSIWDAITDIFAGGIELAVKIVNDGFIDPFNTVAGFFHSKKIDRIGLPGWINERKNIEAARKAPISAGLKSGGGRTGATALANGGIVPGFSPTATADNIPAWLTAGEFVLPVRAVRALKALHGEDFLEMLRQGRVPGYSIGGKVKGAAKHVTGAAKYVQGKAVALAHAPLEWLKHEVRGHYASLQQSGFTDMLIEGMEQFLKAAAAKIGIGGGMDAGGGPITGGSPAVPGNRAANAAAVRKVAEGYGWSSGEMWESLVRLINKESGFNNVAQNPTSTAFGMFQFLNGTWGPGGIAKTSDPYQQAVAGLAYIRGRYGNPTNALAFHNKNNWYSEGGEVSAEGPRRGGPGDVPPTLYDDGGWLPPGLSTVLNASGRPEPVLTAQQWDKVEPGGSGGGHTFPMQILDGPSPDQIAESILFSQRHAERGGVHSRRGRG